MSSALADGVKIIRDNLPVVVENELEKISKINSYMNDDFSDVFLFYNLYQNKILSSDEWSLYLDKRKSNYIECLQTFKIQKKDFVVVKMKFELLNWIFDLNEPEIFRFLNLKYVDLPDDEWYLILFSGLYRDNQKKSLIHKYILNLTKRLHELSPLDSKHRIEMFLLALVIYRFKPECGSLYNFIYEIKACEKDLVQQVLLEKREFTLLLNLYPKISYSSIPSTFDEYVGIFNNILKLDSQLSLNSIPLFNEKMETFGVDLPFIIYYVKPKFEGNDKLGSYLVVKLTQFDDSFAIQIKNVCYFSNDSMVENKNSVQINLIPKVISQQISHKLTEISRNEMCLELIFTKIYFVSETFSDYKKTNQLSCMDECTIFIKNKREIEPLNLFRTKNIYDILHLEGQLYTHEEINTDPSVFILKRGNINKII